MLSYFVHHPYQLFQDKSISNLFIMDTLKDNYGVDPIFNTTIKIFFGTHGVKLGFNFRFELNNWKDNYGVVST